MMLLILSLILLLLLYLLSIFHISCRIRLVSPNVSVKGKNVLLTGCDTGFGYRLCIKLDKLGFRVLEGVYNPDSLKSLKDKLSSNAIAFQLHSTKPEDIDNAFQLVKEQTKILHALINNAGIATCSFIDRVSLDSIRQVLNVNFFWTCCNDLEVFTFTYSETSLVSNQYEFYVWIYQSSRFCCILCVEICIGIIL